MEEDFEEEFRQSMREDQRAIDRALNMLIDGVSSFTSAQGIENIPVGKWAEMLAALDYSKFVVAGVMYSYGLDLNVSHYIEEGIEEEDDEGVE